MNEFNLIIRYSYDEESLDSKNLCEPDDLFHDSDSEVLEDHSGQSLPSSLGAHMMLRSGFDGVYDVNVN